MSKLGSFLLGLGIGLFITSLVLAFIGYGEPGYHGSGPLGTILMEQDYLYRATHSEEYQEIIDREAEWSCGYPTTCGDLLEGIQSEAEGIHEASIKLGWVEDAMVFTAYASIGLIIIGGVMLGVSWWRSRRKKIES